MFNYVYQVLMVYLVTNEGELERNGGDTERERERERERDVIHLILSLPT